MVQNLTVIRKAQLRGMRLISSGRLRESVLLNVDAAANGVRTGLEGLVGEDKAELLAEIQNATSDLRPAHQEENGANRPSGSSHGVPNSAHVRAAFAGPRPLSLNRFNGPNHGGWYSAIDPETAIAEVSYHLTRFLHDSGIYEAAVDYAELFASLQGDFIDLRNVPAHPALHPDCSFGYTAGNALAEAALAQGLSGIIYPSVRRPGATCVTALVPDAVQSIAEGDIWRLIWSGSTSPRIERYRSDGTAF